MARLRRSAKLPDEGIGRASDIQDFEYLLRLPIKYWHRAPEVPAVYFFHTQDNLILYIGSTTNLRKRMFGHKGMFRQIKECGVISQTSFAWFPIPSEHIRSLERQLIDQIKPPFNGIHYSLWPRKTYSSWAVARWIRLIRSQKVA